MLFNFIILETKHLWGSRFFSKYFESYVDSGNAEKTSENIFWFWDNCIWIGCVKHSIYWEKILVIRCQDVNKQSQDFRYYQKWIFRADFLWKWSRNMTKILSCRFKQSFGPFKMLTIYKCSVTRFFGHLINSAFCSL